MATASTNKAWARGGTVLAATLLLLIGVFQFFVGLSAILTNNFYVVGANYTYSFNLTTWGWIHLAIGVAAFITGLALFTGHIVARGVGIFILALSAIANFFFLPYYPLWSLLIIALDVVGIWAIATMGSELWGGAGAGAMAGAGARGRTGEWPGNEPAPAGRHWAPENVKEGTGATRDREGATRGDRDYDYREGTARGDRDYEYREGTARGDRESAEEARQRAEAAARGMNRPDNPQR